MYTFLASKRMAKALRKALQEKGIALSHVACLELVARQFGLADWNTLSARIEAATGGSALRLPKGWKTSIGTNEDFYRCGLDPQHPGVALVESRFGPESGIDLSGHHYGVMMQSIRATSFLGRRVRLSAELETENADFAAIWMRIDRAPGNVFGFDNLMERDKDGGLSGTVGWTERHIVLPVPPESDSVHYGFLLKSYGRVRARSFRLDVVGNEVPLTGAVPLLLPEPENMDFMEG